MGELVPAHDPTDPAGPRVALLAASFLLGVADFLMLAVAIAVGPDDFGGDDHLTITRESIETLGHDAGFIGLLLVGAAVTWAVATKSAHSRNRGLKWILGAQLLATVLLIVPTLG